LFKVKNTLVVAISITAIAATALTGCAKKDVGFNSNKTENNTALVEAEAPTATVGFGSSLDLANGVNLTFTEPVHFVPTKFASNYQKPQIPNKFEVTVVNGGAKVLDLATVSIATKSGTNTCVDVLDGDNGINGAPTDTLKPGATVTFTYGIACMAKIGDPLELTASFGGSVVGVTGTLK
jgi:hypothetical protein